MIIMIIIIICIIIINCSGGDYVVVRCAEKHSFQQLFDSFASGLPNDTNSDSSLPFPIPLPLFSGILSHCREGEWVVLPEELKVGLGEGSQKVTSASRLNVYCCCYY